MDSKQIQTIIEARTDCQIEPHVAERIASARTANDEGQVKALLVGAIGREDAALVAPQILERQKTCQSVWLSRDDSRTEFPYLLYIDGSPKGSVISAESANRIIGRELQDGEQIEVACTAMEGM